MNSSMDSSTNPDGRSETPRTESPTELHVMKKRAEAESERLLRKCRRSREVSAQYEAQAKEIPLAKIEALYYNKIDQYRSKIKQIQADQAFNRYQLDEGIIGRETFDKKDLETTHWVCFYASAELALRKKAPDVTILSQQFPFYLEERQQQASTKLLTQHIESRLKSKSRTIYRPDGSIIKWREQLKEGYENIVRWHSEKEEMIWCAISGEFVDADKMKAAHLIPHATADEGIRIIFGELHAEEILMNARNGLFMHKNFEENLDRGIFIIVATSEHDTEGEEILKVIVLDRYLVQNRRTAWSVNRKEPLTWDQVDGRQVTFPKGCPLRPFKRALLFLALAALTFAKKSQWLGIDQIIHDFIDSKIGYFASPPREKFQHKMLMKFWDDFVGNNAMPFERFTMQSPYRDLMDDHFQATTPLLERRDLKEEEDDEEETDSEQIGQCPICKEKCLYCLGSLKGENEKVGDAKGQTEKGEKEEEDQSQIDNSSETLVHRPRQDDPVTPPGQQDTRAYPM